MKNNSKNIFWILALLGLVFFILYPIIGILVVIFVLSIIFDSNNSSEDSDDCESNKGSKRNKSYIAPYKYKPGKPHNTNSGWRYKKNKIGPMTYTTSSRYGKINQLSINMKNPPGKSRSYNKKFHKPK